MNLKLILMATIALILFGCNQNSLTPTDKSFRYSKSNQTEAILRLDTGGHTAKINDIIVTKSGDIISASDDKTIRVWDSKTGKEKRKILGQIGAGSEGKIYAIALSPNNNFLAVGGMLADNPIDGSTIRIYNYQSGKLLKVLKSHTNVVSDLAFSSDGKYLISGSLDNKVKIWRVEDFILQDTIKFHANDVYAVKIIEKNGNYFAVTAGYDNQIALYNMQTKKIVKSYKLPYKLQFLATSKKHIAVCGYDSPYIKIYDYNLNPTSIQTIKSKTVPTGLAYSPNGEFLIAGTGAIPLNVNIYSVNQDYKKIQSFKKHTNLTQAVAFLDNQTAISGGGNNFEIYIWDIKTAQVLKKIEGVGERVWSVGVKGDRIAWANRWQGGDTHKGGTKLQKSINLKNFQISGQILNSKLFKRISVETSHGLSLQHRKDGNYGKNDAVLDIKKDGKTIASIIRGSTNGVRHNCYGFYKNYIISGGSNGNLKIYNLKGQEIANLIGHEGDVWSIALDGDRLVSGSNDQTIRIWDLSKLDFNKKLKIDEKILNRGMKKLNLSREETIQYANKHGINIYLTQELQPTLNLFISKTNDWIAWTPNGFYNASKGAEKYIGYHINRGSDKEAIFLPISSFSDKFYRPDIIAKAVNGEDISKYNTISATQLVSKSGLPPKIKIENQPFETDKDMAQIGIKVCERDGGFGKLIVKVDGKIMGYLGKTKAFRHRVQKSGANCNIIEEKVTIPSGGEHIVEVMATNRDNNIYSKADSIKVKSLKTVEKKPNLHLLTLSIADYKDDSLDLKYPNNDADELTKKVKEIGKKVYNKIYTYNLKDSEVTLDNIKRKVSQIAPNVQSNDVFVLYISGHGITNDKSGDYYFIPYNCDSNSDETKCGVSKNNFKEILSQIKATKSAILLDTCESGSMASKELLNTSIDRLGNGVGTAIIAGATSKQSAIDGYKNHGVFTYTVLDAMNNPKVYSFDDKLSINEIAEYTKYLLPKLAKEKFGYKQEPTIYMNGDTSFAIGGI